MEQLPNYEKEHHKQFVQDMIDSGYGEYLRHYQGRSFYEGPAVTTSRKDDVDQQDIIRSTELKLQIDNIGLDYILYPRS
jgi:hypothetical protein